VEPACQWPSCHAPHPDWLAGAALLPCRAIKAPRLTGRVRPADRPRASRLCHASPFRRAVRSPCPKPPPPRCPNAASPLVLALRPALSEAAPLSGAPRRSPTLPSPSARTARSTPTFTAALRVGAERRRSSSASPELESTPSRRSSSSNAAPPPRPVADAVLLPPAPHRRAPFGQPRHHPAPWPTPSSSHRPLTGEPLRPTAPPPWAPLR
jgi:hypothetical protein